MNKLAYETYKNTLLTVSKMIAIGDLFSYGDRDLKIDQDRDRYRDRNFRDRGHALPLGRMNRKEGQYLESPKKHSVGHCQPFTGLSMTNKGSFNNRDERLSITF